MILARLTGMSRAAKAAVAVALLVLVIVLGITVDYFISTMIIHRADAQQKAEIAQAKADEDAAIRAAVAYSDQRWCGALTLLTEKPVPKPADPAANPSREGEYLFYVDLLSVKKGFRCQS
jgi:hypothetical protein